MNKILKFGILCVCFIVSETIIGFIVLLIIGLINNTSNGFAKQIYDASAVVLINLLRLIFYALPSIIAFGVLFKYVNRLEVTYKPMLFSVFNVLIFVGLTLLYKLNKEIPTLEFKESLFWATIVSIFLAPIVLGRIPYFRRLMESF